jgi:hypothetical protein
VYKVKVNKYNGNRLGIEISEKEKG